MSLCRALGFVLVGPLAAQTFIVDQNGGPGVHYQDLPRAVAAVPDGAVLRVRAGNYSTFVLANKGLSILGDARSTEMQKTMNLKIKFRESFRPFAPAGVAPISR